MENKEAYKVYWIECHPRHPKGKRVYHKGEFEKRQKARNWCRNHSYRDKLTIVHPNGTEELYAQSQTN